MRVIEELNKWVIATGAVVAIGGVTNATATVWVTPINGGEMRFDDWGYTGPGGRTAADFAPINGFGNNPLDPNGGVGQVQHVVTKDPDRLTVDPPYDALEEFTNAPKFFDANMDAQVNFYNWAYTTVQGSRFDNMQIDYDGDYLVKRSDMRFQFYDVFSYQNEGSNAAAAVSGDYATSITFQPYALSDATGWCGSILGTNPAALEPMAGQVTFDFGFDTYLFGGQQGYMQVVPGFQMRSYGTLEIEIAAAAGGNGDIHYTADAVVNNTNPSVSATNPATGLKEVGGGGVDPAFYNQVSFMGGGIVPEGSWILAPEGVNIPVLAGGSYALTDDLILMVLGGEESVVPEMPIDPETGQPMQGQLLYHKNTFANFTFLMRADGERYVDGIDFAHYNDFSGVPAFAFDAEGNLVNLAGDIVQDLSRSAVPLPLPPAAWLFGSALAGLIGLRRQRRGVHIAVKSSM